MSIIKKTILMIVGITVVLFSFVYVISNFIYLKGFQDLEKQQIEHNVARVTHTVSIKIDSLNSFCYDWANWDDTYNFAKNFNQEYIDRNLTEDTFITGDISLFLVIDPQGTPVYGKYYDFSEMQETALPAGVPDLISGTVMPHTKDTPSGFSGIAMISGEPMMISCRQLLTSLKEGPSTGYLVITRTIDNAALASISNITQFPVSLLDVREQGVNPELDTALKSLQNNPFYILTQPGKTIAGYSAMRDLDGNIIGVYKILVPRDIFAQGQKAIGYLHSSLFIIAIAFCFIFVIFFRYLILSRLTTLSNAVNAIGSTGEISSRVQVKGNDELGRLGTNINNMLESLEKSESRRQSQKEIIGHIVTLTPNGVAAVNDTGYITLINDAFRTMFNLGNRSVMNTRLEDLPDMSDIAIEINNFRLSRMSSFRKELHRVRNGTKKIYIANFARLKEEEVYILYLTDISEERSKQESLYLTDRLASIGEMASGIAHELNNPLTSIIGLSEIVMRDNVPESIKEDIGLIKSESHRAAGIVRNLLSFARKNATLKQPDNINKILTDVLRLRSYEHGVNNIKIIKELDTTLPDILVDHSQIQQVFINIILNAEYAMVNAHGKGTLRVKTEKVDNMLRTSFTDDGPGIEPGNLRHIFDPFFTTKEVGKGTGLGLSISYGIVTAHNGQIYATSEFGKGATFVVDLPLKNQTAKESKGNA